MEKIINIIFYIMGIGLPILIVLVALFKKRKKHKLKNIFSKCLIAVIIFSIFYIIKLGGMYLINKDNKSDNNKELTTNVITTSSSVKTSSTTKNNDAVKIKVVDGVTYVSGILIANKTYPLPSDFVPKNTHKSAEGLKYCTECIDNDAWDAYNEMKADATSIGLNIYIQSGYRSYELQNELYNKYVNRDGKVAADTYSARPGNSEHQTGLAFDLNSITDDFQYTSEGKWVNENCYKYGFILRYPKGKENETGYKFESWHLRYVGKELANIIYNNGEWRTLEEYLDITSAYSD